MSKITQVDVPVRKQGESDAAFLRRKEQAFSAWQAQALALIAWQEDQIFQLETKVGQLNFNIGRLVGKIYLAKTALAEIDADAAPTRNIRRRRQKVTSRAEQQA